MQTIPKRHPRCKLKLKQKTARQIITFLILKERTPLKMNMEVKMQAKLLSVKNICKTFIAKGRVLDGLDLTVESGTIQALIGVNGVGKSTLCKIIIGLYQADSGTISLFGQMEKEALQIARQQIAYQGSDLLNQALTVRQNLDLVCQLQRIDKANWSELASYFDIITHLDTNVNKLSKGIKQRILLIMTFMADKALYILDEPFINLDAISTHKLIELIKKRQLEKQQSFIICSHNLYLLNQLADNFAFLQHGKIKQNLNRNELNNLSNMTFQLSTTNNKEALSLLSKLPDLRNLRFDDEKGITFNCATKLDYVKLNKLLYTNNVYIEKLGQDKLSIDQYVYELNKEV